MTEGILTVRGISLLYTARKESRVRRILELCIELDRCASQVYAGLASATSDPEVATVFETLAREEVQHVDWWTDLMVAWDAGLIPDIVGEHDLLERLLEIQEDMEAAIPEHYGTLSTDQMFDLAARLEFYMLDSAFSELVDLMQPGSRVTVNRAYALHVLHLVEAIEKHYSPDGLARFLARVLQRSYRDQQRLVALAIRDQLTGLLNRRGVFGHLKQWASWAQRYHRPVAVVLLDIDRFKKVNDTHGHAAGDLALKAVAGALEMAVRDSDIVGRFGGDEFLVLAPETEGKDLAALMERIAQHVREAGPSVDGKRLDLSVSVGGAWSAGPGAQPDTLVSAADRSLYAAKDAGRDRAGTPIAIDSEVAM